MQTMAPPRKPKNNKESSNPKPAAQRSSYSACYSRFVPEAMKLPAADVVICRADVRIAFVNVKHGINAVCADPERIREALPRIPLNDVLSLPDLCRALIFATTRITGRPASSKEIEAQLAVIREPREQMLQVAETLAAKKLLPADEVAAIRAGSGKYDMASDGVALVRVYGEHADAVRGRHPFTSEEFERLRVASEWLLDNITPDGARRPTERTRGDAAEMRDRLWTLLLRRYSDLRAIGYYFHRDNLEEFTPKLQSRLGAGVAPEDEVEDEVEVMGAEAPADNPPV